jgi:hypothetical protein
MKTLKETLSPYVIRNIIIQISGHAQGMVVYCRVGITKVTTFLNFKRRSF